MIVIGQGEKTGFISKYYRPSTFVQLYGKAKDINGGYDRCYPVTFPEEDGVYPVEFVSADGDRFDAVMYFWKRKHGTCTNYIYYSIIVLSSDTESHYYAFEKFKNRSDSDPVRITYYKTTETMERSEAIRFYKRCAENSEGSEQQRYYKIVTDLEKGLIEINDGEE